MKRTFLQHSRLKIPCICFHATNNSCDHGIKKNIFGNIFYHWFCDFCYQVKIFWLLLRKETHAYLLNAANIVSMIKKVLATNDPRYIKINDHSMAAQTIPSSRVWIWFHQFTYFYCNNWYIFQLTREPCEAFFFEITFYWSIKRSRGVMVEWIRHRTLERHWSTFATFNPGDVNGYLAGINSLKCKNAVMTAMLKRG